MRVRLPALALALAAPLSWAAPPAPPPPTTPPVAPDKTSAVSHAFTWDTARLTSPESVDELKALQTRVKAVYQKSLPTTVGLVLGGPGQGPGSAGSGVIVSADGLVLTAAHVIGKPREPVRFTLSDGRVVKGITLGTNSKNDSGMAKITDAAPKDYPGAKDGKWPFAEVGAADALKPGQWIVSMGHPGGPKVDRPPPVRTGRFVSLDKAGWYDEDDVRYDTYRQAVDKIKSRLGDRFSRPEVREQQNDLLRSDATLVGGDSGGPLFDLDGKVVGIHSEIGERLDQNRHVPTEKFKSEWERMARGDILYFPANVTREQATRAALNVEFDEKAKGARVEALPEVNGGPGAAEKAKMEAGDVIVKFNGHAVESVEDFRAMMPSYKPGETVPVVVDRNGTLITLEVKLAEKPRQRGSR